MDQAQLNKLENLVLSKGKFDAKNWPNQKVRKAFIDFFVQKYEHVFWASNPVVPHDDPTLLFTNAGMNQYKPLFLGQGDPKKHGEQFCTMKRAVNSQKCIRAGGKHNDLDDVGKDTYHHTFFEMLGNWSFGDFFKKEIIEWSMELLVGVFGLPKEQLYATYFGGDESQGLPPDNEARDYWLKFLPAERVLPFDMKDNFWEMGEVGPCGPCSEIHFDRLGGRNAASLVNMDDPTVIEIWNLVFMQFNREVDKTLKPLPQKHIDTGMGFERLTSILQGKLSNYDTDIFTPIFTAIQKATSCPEPYGGLLGDEDKKVNNRDTAYRVVADHIRTLTFAITDGADPSNDGRGYVLRRILRRGVRYGHTLGAKNGFFHTLVKSVVEVMGDMFPELKKAQARVEAVIKDEEEVFGRTLSRGVRLFKEVAEKVKSEGKNVIPGDSAFTLYDTFGFPLDLTQIMAEEVAMTVDIPGYEKAMKVARDRSRDAGKVDRQRALVLEAEQTNALAGKGVTSTDDAAKYVWNQDVTATVKAIYKVSGDFVDSASASDEHLGVVLDKTNFYAESGGQVNDTGALVGNGSEVTVSNVQGFGGFVLHCGPVTTGTIKVGDQVTCKVNYELRSRIAPNHTCTHVLNWALRKVLGNRVDQKGSLVDGAKLRFDFTQDKPMSPESVEKVEELVRGQVKEKLPVYNQVCPLEAAKRINSLRAVFGEMYPDPVRVVSVGAEIDAMIADPDKEEWHKYSVEFCGGTHLTNTSEAIDFALISEEGIAKGIRRVVCYTHNLAADAHKRADEFDARIKQAESLQGDALDAKISELVAENQTADTPLARRNKAKNALNAMKTALIQREKAAQAERALKQVEIANQKADELAAQNVYVYVDQMDFGLDANTAKKVIAVFEQKCPNTAVLIASADHAKGKVAIYGACNKEVSQKLSAKDWCGSALAVVGGKGGGKPTNAQGQGSDLSKIPEALETARAFAKSKLA